MAEQEYHEMVLNNIHPSGTEEWYCPTCGRRFLMQWPPAYNKVILEPGDETAIHSGGKGGVSVQTPQAAPEVEQLSPEEEALLEPWVAWMEKTNFDTLWDRSVGA